MRTLQNKRDVATSRSSGPVNTRLIHALEQATGKIGSKDVIRLLSAPPLVYSAVWLKSLRHRNDRVIVIETIVPQIRALKIYAMGEFLDLLRLDTTMLVEHSQRIKTLNKKALPRTPKG